MKIAFNPSTVAALITPPNNKDITFDLRGQNIFARGVKFQGTDTNTWRDIKVNNVSIGSNILDLRNGSNTTLINTNGVVTINSTWRPVVDNLTSNSTTSSLSANQGRILAGLINGKSDSDHNHDGRYLRLNGSDTMQGNLYLHSHGSSYIGRGSGDKSGADFTEANIVIRSWWGISFKSYDDIVRTYIDTRTGNIGTKGVLNAASAVIQGRVYNSGDDEGIIIKPASNGWAGLILGTHNGARSVFYFVKGEPFWRYNNGSTSLDIMHPKKSGTIALTSDIPSSLKNPASLTTFGVVYDGSVAKIVTLSNFVSQMSEGTSDVTDGTMLITSYATNNGFADSNALNAPFKRKAVHLWGYIKGKTDSLYATKSHNHDDRYLKLTGGTMLLGEGLKFHADNNYFGTDADARIISLLDGNDKICDGGLIIDERATLNGKEYITELLRIRDSEFKWRGADILHSGNYSSILDYRYYTESEVNNLLSKKLNTSDFNWINLPDKIVAGNEFNIVSAGYDTDMWFNYLPINYKDKTATISNYYFGNGHKGLATVQALGFIKSGSSSSYVLLGDGDHKAESSLRVAYAASAGNAGTLGGMSKNYSQAPFGTIPYIGNDGVMEIGRYIDFHYDNSGSYDYSTRLQASGNNRNTVTLPSASGTLALINDVNNYYWANVKISTSSSTTTSPTVSKLTATRVCAGHDPGIDNSISCSNWFRSSGNTGWYNTTYRGGWYMSDTSWIKAYNDVGIYTSGQMKARGFHHESVDSDNYILLAGGGYKSFGGDDSTPIFLGYLNLDHGNDGTVSSSFHCLGYSVSFTYTRGGNYCKIFISDTARLSFYINAAIASVNYSGGGMDTWVGTHRSAGAWWLHCYASGWNEVRVKGFRQASNKNDSWWGGNPLGPANDTANRITVCIFGHVKYRY